MNTFLLFVNVWLCQIFYVCFYSVLLLLFARKLIICSYVHKPKSVTSRIFFHFTKWEKSFCFIASVSLFMCSTFSEFFSDASWFAWSSLGIFSVWKETNRRKNLEFTNSPPDSDPNKWTRITNELTVMFWHQGQQINAAK